MSQFSSYVTQFIAEWQSMSVMSSPVGPSWRKLKKQHKKTTQS